MLSRARSPLARTRQTLRHMATGDPSTIYGFTANDLDTNVSAAAWRAGAGRGRGEAKFWNPARASRRPPPRAAGGPHDRVPGQGGPGGQRGLRVRPHGHQLSGVGGAFAQLPSHTPPSPLPVPIRGAPLPAATLRGFEGAWAGDSSLPVQPVREAGARLCGRDSVRRPACPDPLSAPCPRASHALLSPCRGAGGNQGVCVQVRRGLPDVCQGACLPPSPTRPAAALTGRPDFCAAD